MKTKTPRQTVRLSEDDAPQRRYTLEEYQQMIEKGRRQIENGECLSTEEVMQMCTEDELELVAV